MNTVELGTDRLTIRVPGFDAVLAFRRRIDIPLHHVRGATLDPGILREPKGLRLKGLRLQASNTPMKMSGTFLREGGRTFWNADNTQNTVVIELANEYFERIVLTIDDPKTIVRQINAALLLPGGA